MLSSHHLVAKNTSSSLSSGASLCFSSSSFSPSRFLLSSSPASFHNFSASVTCLSLPAKSVFSCSLYTDKYISFLYSTFTPNSQSLISKPFFSSFSSSSSSSSLAASFSSSTTLDSSTSVASAIQPSTESSSSACQRVLLAETRIEEDICDIDSWEILMKESPSAELFENALEVFSTCGKFWFMYVQYEIRQGNYSKAFLILKRCLTSCPPHFCLWVTYVCFVYEQSSALNYINALVEAVESVGSDYRSGGFWKELLSIKIKIFNESILVRGDTQGLLNDPFKNDSKLGSSCNSVLIPNDLEQKLFSEKIDNSEKTLIEQHAEINQMRKFYRESLSTSTEYTSEVWNSYCLFERSVGMNLALANKLITEFESRFVAAKNAYKDLCKLYGNVDTIIPAIPLNELNAKTFKTILKSWRRIIEFEKSNPLKLPYLQMQKRVIFTYQLCLLSCVYHADISCDFFQFLLANKLKSKALDWLRRIIDRFLPNDELLNLILADFMEENHQITEAAEIYKGLISQHKTSLDDEENHEDITVVLIHYLNFIRRNCSENTWRRAFESVIKLKDCGWAVYINQALAELLCCKSIDGAVHTLNLAKQKFSLLPEFIAAYADFLVHIGNIEGAEELLVRGVENIHREKGICSELLWKKLIKLIHRYSIKSNLSQLYDLYIRQAMNKDIEIEILSSKNCACERLDDLNASYRRKNVQNHTSFSASAQVSSASLSLAEHKILTNMHLLNESRMLHVNSDTGRREINEVLLRESSVEKEMCNEEDLEELIEAKVNILRRQFAGGKSLQKLYFQYSFGNFHPKTSMIDIYLRKNKLNSKIVTDEDENIKNELEEEDDAENEDLFESEKVARSKTNENFRGKSVHTASSDFSLIVRPDITKMTAFKPILSNCIQMNFNDFKGSSFANTEDVDLSSMNVASFKALYDFLCILPQPKFIRKTISPQLVDYLITKLQQIELPQICINKFEPIDVKQILALRKSIAESSDIPFINSILEKQNKSLGLNFQKSSNFEEHPKEFCFATPAAPSVKTSKKEETNFFVANNKKIEETTSITNKRASSSCANRGGSVSERKTSEAKEASKKISGVSAGSKSNNKNLNTKFNLASAKSNFKKKTKQKIFKS